MVSKSKNYRVGSKLISNTIYLFLDLILVTFLSFIFWLILGKSPDFSPEDYGLVATFSQFFLFISSFAALGLSLTIKKLVPELIQKNHKKKVQGLIIYSIKITSIISIIAALILIIFSTRISPYLKLEPNVIWLSAALVVITTVGTILGAVHYGFQDMKRIFLTDLSGQLAKIIIAVSLIFLGFGYFGPLVGLFFCYLVILITRLDRSLFSISKKTVVDKKLILSFSIPAFITNMFLAIFTKTQYVILTVLETVKATGVFAVPMNITFVIPIIPSVLNSALFPILSSLGSDKNRKYKQAYLMKLVFRYSLLFVLPISIFLILFSDHVILLFSKEEYLEGSIYLPLLTLSGLLLGLGQNFTGGLYAIGKPKIQRNIWIFTSLTYLPLALILTYYFSAMGLAVSYLISTFFIISLGLIFIKKHLDFKLPIKDIGRMILGIFIPSIFLVFLRAYMTDLLMVGVAVLIASFVYLLILLKLNFYLKEDLKVLDFLIDRTPVFKKEVIGLRKFLSKFATRSYY